MSLLAALAPRFGAGWCNRKGHILPYGDTRPHAESADCWCEPFDDNGVIVHNAHDERDRFERGIRRPS